MGIRWADPRVGAEPVVVCRGDPTASDGHPTLRRPISDGVMVCADRGRGNHALPDAVDEVLDDGQVVRKIDAALGCGEQSIQMFGQRGSNRRCLFDGVGELRRMSRGQGHDHLVGTT